MRRLVVFTLLVALLGAQAPAGSTPGTVRAVGLVFTDYIPGSRGYPQLEVLRGDRLFLVNLGPSGEQDEHDLIHLADVPLFHSASVRPGGTAEVFGVLELEPGRYPFGCTIHPNVMGGTLVVTQPSVG